MHVKRGLQHLIKDIRDVSHAVREDMRRETGALASPLVLDVLRAGFECRFAAERMAALLELIGREE